MLTNNAALGWLELDELTYQAGITPVTFDAWEQLQDALHLVATYPPVDKSVRPGQAVHRVRAVRTGAIAGDTLAQILAYLAQLTGWDREC